MHLQLRVLLAFLDNAQCIEFNPGFAVTLVAFSKPAFGGLKHKTQLYKMQLYLYIYSGCAT